MPRKTRRPPVATDKRFARHTSDIGTPERWQHSGRVFEPTEIAGIVAVRATEEHVLDRLLLRRLIGLGAHAAGLRLQEDYACAGLGGRVAASYSGVRGGGHAEFTRSPSQEAAYQRWRRAVEALAGRARICVMRTACEGSYPAPAGWTVLKSGLEILARHYGTAK